MNAIKALGHMLETNATDGAVLDDLLKRNPVDPLVAIVELFTPGRVASGLPIGAVVVGGHDPATGPPSAGGAVLALLDGVPVANEAMQSEARALIGALCSAAKADKVLDESARGAVLARLSELDIEAQIFIDAELSKPPNVRDYVRCVPAGLAHQAYAMAVMGLPADSRQMVQYLSALAQGLEIDWIAAKRIHAEIGGPDMFG